MKKCIVIPDSFKGSISSHEFCKVVSNCIAEKYPDCIVKAFSIADGGEGTVDSYIQIFNSEKITVKTIGADNKELNAYYTMHGQTGVLEVASVVGIPLLKTLIPTKATTFGLGALISDAVSKGAKKIIIGLGGSSTTDAGIGMALALGVKFYNKRGIEFIPTPLTMVDIVRIDNSKALELLADIDVIAMCDVNNVLFGTSGAAFVFAPQKGADEKEVAALDENLQHIGKLFDELKGYKVSQAKGSGAAGGLGAAIITFLNGRLKSGIEVLLDLIEFDRHLTDADLVITGEGRFDSQTLDGKVISGIAKRTKKADVPLVVLCGGYDTKLYDLEKHGISAVFSLNTIPQSLEKAKADAKDNLKSVMNNILSLLNALIKRT